MVSDGNATVIVSNMDASIRFYTEVLGLKLTNRFGNDWATVRAGNGLVIGLHPASPRYPAPGTRGSVVLGLDLNISIEKAVARLAAHNVSLRSDVTRSEPGNFVSLEDPDGHEIYLWEKSPLTQHDQELATASI